MSFKNFIHFILKSSILELFSVTMWHIAAIKIILFKAPEVSVLSCTTQHFSYTRHNGYTLCPLCYDLYFNMYNN